MSVRSGRFGANPISLSKALALGWILFVAFAYLLRPPYWSLMDDLSNQTLVRFSWAHLSWWQAITDYVRTDLAVIGMFRPIYPAYSYWFYRIFMYHPAAGYSFLAIILFFLFWGWSLAFRALTDWGEESYWLYFILACTFTPHFNLFFHASLLEKFVILSGLAAVFTAIAVLSVHSLNWRKSIGFALLFVLSSLVGFLAKPNTLFMLAPISLLLFFDALEHKELQRWFLLGFLIIFEIGLGRYFLSIRVGYTSRYDFVLVSNRLFHPGMRFIVFEVLGLAGMLPAFFKTPHELMDGIGSWDFKRAFWPIGLFAFLAIMMPWVGGISAYYLAPGGVFAVGTAAQLFLWILQEGEKSSLIGPAISILLLSLTVTSGATFYRRLETNSAVPQIVQWLQEQSRASNAQARFVMPTPCSEEHGSLSQFSNLPFSEAIGDRLPDDVRGHPVYLVTMPNCPPRPIEGFIYHDTAFKAGYWKIFVSDTTREKPRT